SSSIGNECLQTVSSAYKGPKSFLSASPLYAIMILQTSEPCPWCSRGSSVPVQARSSDYRQSVVMWAPREREENIL
ncbi:hypothetical protein NDU88_006828, partial [Pleurodeles waltl]